MLTDALEKDGLYDLFAELELPLSAVLADMELQGIKVDTDLLKEMSEEVQKQLLDLTGEIYALAGKGLTSILHASWDIYFLIS